MPYLCGAGKVGFHNVRLIELNVWKRLKIKLIIPLWTLQVGETYVHEPEVTWILIEFYDCDVNHTGRNCCLTGQCLSQ